MFDHLGPQVLRLRADHTDLDLAVLYVAGALPHALHDALATVLLCVQPAR